MRSDVRRDVVRHVDCQGRADAVVRWPRAWDRSYIVFVRDEISGLTLFPGPGLTQYADHVVLHFAGCVERGRLLTVTAQEA